MRKRKTEKSVRRTWKSALVMWICIAGAVVYVAMKFAMAWDMGVASDIFTNFIEQMKNPFYIEIVKPTAAFVLFACIGVALIFAGTLSRSGKWRSGTEHGSSKWGTPKSLNAVYKQEENIILTQNVRFGIDTRKHGKACNVLVLGAAGSGKTQGYVIPNLMQMNTSYVTIDPSGETLRATGKMLEENGYTVKVLDVMNMKNTHRFNPFHYIKDELDVKRLATSFTKSTTDKTKMGGDQFFTDGMQQILEALIGFLYEAAAPYERTFGNLCELLKHAEIKSDDMGEESDSELDRIFAEWGEENPESFAWGQWQMFKTGAPKTRASVITTLATRLGGFNIKKVADFTSEDELELEKMGSRKTALFCIIPEGEQSFDFLIAMMYTTLFMALYREADNREDGYVGLDIPVHMIMDEWANTGLPEAFAEKISTCRKRNIYISIIVQGMSQIKSRMDKAYETVVSNCPSIIYLGSNEDATWEFVSKGLGKETIKAQTSGRQGSSLSASQQLIGRELLTPDEVRRLDRSKAILMIQGEFPVIDDKFDIMSHLNIRQTMRGGAEPYRQNILHISQDEIDAVQRSLTDFEFGDFAA